MVEPEALLDWCRDQAAEVQIDTSQGVWLLSGRGVALLSHGLPRRVGAEDLRPALAELDPRQLVTVARNDGHSFRDMTLNELSLAVAMACMQPADDEPATPKPATLDPQGTIDARS